MLGSSCSPAPAVLGLRPRWPRRAGPSARRPRPGAPAPPRPAAAWRPPGRRCGAGRAVGSLRDQVEASPVRFPQSRASSRVAQSLWVAVSASFPAVWQGASRSGQALGGISHTWAGGRPASAGAEPPGLPGPHPAHSLAVGRLPVMHAWYAAPLWAIHASSVWGP